MDGFSKFQRHMFTIDSKPINFYAKNLFPWLLPIASLCLRKWGEGLHIPFRIERVTASMIIILYNTGPYCMIDKSFCYILQSNGEKNWQGSDISKTAFLI